MYVCVKRKHYLKKGNEDALEGGNYLGVGKYFDNFRMALPNRNII